MKVCDYVRVFLRVTLVLATILHEFKVFVLVSGITGSSEYFWQRMKLCSSGGQSYLQQKWRELRRGVPVHHSMLSRWNWEESGGNVRGNAGVTCLCKEAQGRLSLWCCKHNEMDFPCNQSVKLSIFSNLYTQWCHQAVELFYKEALLGSLTYLNLTYTFSVLKEPNPSWKIHIGRQLMFFFLLLFIYFNLNEYTKQQQQNLLKH